MHPYWKDILEEYKKYLDEEERQKGPCGLSEKRVNELTKQHEVQNGNISSETAKP